MNKLIIGTRGSKLALWQAYYTQDRLKEIGVESELKIITTKGDKIQHLSFDKIEGKGFFTKEIEDELLAGTIDLAVHSMKDMPTTQPEGLSLAAISYREDPADCLVIRKDAATQGKLLQLPDNPIVGTSSARRKALMKTIRPDAVLKDIRGNVPTRLQKLKEGQFDAILLAIAGINRLELDMSDFEMIRLNPKEFVPAPAQGVLTWQTKTDNMDVRRTLRKLHRSDVLQCTNVERKVLRLLDGGCHLPLGVYCEEDDMGYYHVCSILSGGLDQELTVVNLSSSTTKNLAETIFAKLTQGVELNS
ncbi:MAG: Porphobilinogen deaminase (EC [uncultured Aureispira sp.]|jgi:hydroxymethylbilane synthase|uniref:Porphobilinogen deaminase n=1 Tax=uncultured Aureispira sp. TaxID=1331704 RepID=A0A6S6S661_9BACT|nr:MAG: Porphobilinogen deaminase (EC [uncultured Aureispira sp.]